MNPAITALRNDLIHHDGPRISTMRNYRFAILPYDPTEEYKLRAHIEQLTTELQNAGWITLNLDLQKIFLARVHSMGPEWRTRVADMERRMNTLESSRGLNYLKGKIEPLLEGPTGIAADCARIITAQAAQHPDKADRMIVFISRAGALYPFFRNSALLKHLDGHTQNIPVVLLYPGERRGDTGLSFMGILNPDNDYRPRIYT
jgi:hypothetical protein